MGTTAAVAAVKTAETIVDYREKRKQQKNEKKRIEEEHKLKEEEIAAKKKVYEEDKTNLLKAKIAAQRAKLSANGVNATTGSSAALISNLEKATNEEIAQNNYFSDLDLKKENANYQYKKRANLLNASKTLYDSTFSYANSMIGLYDRASKKNND